MDGKELFLMIEAISNEKNITKEDVLESLEEALAVATKKRNNIEVRVESTGIQASSTPLDSGKSSKTAKSSLMTTEQCSIQNCTFIKLMLME